VLEACTGIKKNPFVTGQLRMDVDQVKIIINHINPLLPSDAVRKQKKKIRGSFQFSFVTIEKISSLWKPEI